ncbi:class IV aminotransferase [Kribbella sandramycini]|uniref:Branched-subunit amino acid aminotransferase/4-amino-4-deoxychorismate lyase n=1 Tax=Kribbella sandramycini TaxID=60450 RepID=A0A7Y4L500_9ACTN|nr:aminotransferase class IV [Kribbella sandramycini]MBB6571810.1 branched-subunit amino acid aminotransferase/4-amino-4-deoxychorismate lyase [Kribbella sandramycini]NOL44452.1 class IV aminotransferase [Kribbella sandramycini]
MSGLLVADSFLVVDGGVRGLDLHRERFVGSCAAAGVDAVAFWEQQINRLPGFGRWFPRFELRDTGELAVQRRPAPPTGGRVRVALHEGPDPRTSPRVKGPDLALLGKLKDAAPHRADELVLLDSDGTVLEAAYAAIAWWEGETLCFPPPTSPLLPSVTATLLQSLATTHNTPTAHHARTPADLQSTEVWLLNSLHGIRPVHAWNNSPIDPLPNSTAPHWQSHLHSLTKPI